LAPVTTHQQNQTGIHKLLCQTQHQQAYSSTNQCRIKISIVMIMPVMAFNVLNTLVLDIFSTMIFYMLDSMIFIWSVVIVVLIIIFMIIIVALAVLLAIIILVVPRLSHAN